MEEAVLLEKARALLRRIYTEGAPMEDILTETNRTSAGSGRGDGNFSILRMKS